MCLSFWCHKNHCCIYSYDVRCVMKIYVFSKHVPPALQPFPCECSSLFHISYRKSPKPFFHPCPKIWTGTSGKHRSFIVFQHVAMVLHLQPKSIGCATSEEADLRDSTRKPRDLYYPSHCFRQSLILDKACAFEALVTRVRFYVKPLLVFTCIMEQQHDSATFQLSWSLRTFENGLNTP